MVCVGGGGGGGWKCLKYWSADCLKYWSADCQNFRGKGDFSLRGT